jgi:gamma-glutamyltranspeptidase/glutathione hydrolase
VIPVRTVILALAAVVVAFPASAGARTSQGASNTTYSLSALALLGPDRTDISLRVVSPTAPLPEMLDKVQVKVWPLGNGNVETRNFFDVPAPEGVASLSFHQLARLQRVQVRVHVKHGSQNVLETETQVQYRALGAVSTDHPLATMAAERILRAGGNAFDAAAAALFVLNVTQPHLAGIGGSSNIVAHVAEDGRDYSIDARERAPAATTPDMYASQMLPVISVNGYSVGVPGTLRAVERMLDEWGTMTLSETLDDAIRYAENGFPVGAFLAREAGSADPGIWKDAFQPETKALFRPGGVPVKQGDLLVQPDLAKTFRLIKAQGSSVFYRGEIASAVVEAQRRHSVVEGEGRMTLADLASYDVVVRPASHLDYRGYDVYSAAPSSSGGLVLLEALGLLEDDRFPIGDAASGYGFGTRYTIHAMVEALRLALADRDAWVGDPAFFPVPEQQLLSDAYLRDRSTLMNPFPARMPAAVPPGNPFAFPPALPLAEAEAESGHTTHFSVIDKYGNVVSFTTTMADSFGSGITVPGYGFLLNDSLRLFNRVPTSGPNDAGPNKRPMGSMTPVVIMKDGEPFAATGTYGAMFIPSMVLNVVVDLIDHRMPLQQAVDASRLWITQSTGGWAWNSGRRGAPSFSLVEIDALRELGPPRPVRVPSARDEIFGSLASVAVDLATFELQSAADDQRQTDASAAVVQR